MKTLTFNYRPVREMTLLVCLTVCLATATLTKVQSQTITLTHLPEWGSDDFLQGRVTGVDPANYRVLVYLYFEGSWYVKPYNAAPLTLIMPDSNWSCDVKTGGCDAYAARYAAFLIPADFVPPGVKFVQSLPNSLYQHPYVYRCRIPGSRTLDFAGFRWKVKGLSGNCKSGPSKSYNNLNAWTDADTAVFVDEKGYLHLRIVYDTQAREWKCTEVIADTSLGYGTYTFTVKNRLDSLDKNVVFSPFIYDEYGDTNHYREIDIEASRWEVATDPDFQYVIQPWDAPGNRHRFNTTHDTGTVHQFLWKQDSVFFASKKRDGSLIHSWNFGGPFVQTPSKENVRINLWLFSSDNIPADTTQPIEIIVEDFDFKSVLPPPGDVSATKGDPQDHITITWSPVPRSGYYRVYKGFINQPAAATPLTDHWITETIWDDFTVNPGRQYFYWVRAADNLQGSNSSGYSSGFSEVDTGWLSRSRDLQDLTIAPGQDTCFDAAQNITTAGNGTLFIVMEGGDVSLSAGQQINLLPGTRAFSGSHLTALISGDVFCRSSEKYAMESSMTDQQETTMTMEKKRITVFPNPTNGTVTVMDHGDSKNNPVVFELYNSLGQVVFRENRQNLLNYKFSLAGYPSGIYILIICSTDVIETIKIIKQ